MRSFVLIWVQILALSTVVRSEDDSSSFDPIQNTKDHVHTLMNWASTSSEGFFWNSKLEIRPVNPEDPSSRFGVFATADISPEERIFSMPKDLQIQSDNDLSPVKSRCSLTQKLVHEIKQRQKSIFEPLISYYLDQEAFIPALYSDRGKDLMREITGFHRNGARSEFGPELTADWMLRLHSDECYDYDDHLSQASMALVATMSLEGRRFVPLFNFFQADPYLGTENTESTATDHSTHSSGDVHIAASKQIAAGDEIIVSYNPCIQFLRELEMCGTLEKFRDRGAIEPYPRMFHFHDQKSTFRIDQDDSDSKKLSVTWLSAKPSFNATVFYTNNLARFRDIRNNKELEFHRPHVSDREWDAAMEFVETVVEAFSAVVDDIRRVSDSEMTPCNDDGYCYDESDERYQDFDLEIDMHQEYFYIYQAETLVFAVDHWPFLDEFRSHYQLLQYYTEPDTGDVCFDLDTIFQMCKSYQPQYHEMQAQQIARYLPEPPKRILWVGGGDNMLLQEFLKYPSLELAVGLELDQKVSRGAFKHFGTSPHFDNEKVQWWFGDASKSILMLPEEYFGSFDMVVVDLSDTVLALTVSKKLDVVAALSMLLKPGGVFCMNELFFNKVSEVFEYTIDWRHYNVPKVADQAVMIASNDMDFFDRVLTDHKVENNMYIKPLDKKKGTFDNVHAYSWNPGASYRSICGKLDEEVSDEQEVSPGIFMVVEAENITATIESPKAFRNVILPVLEAIPLRVEKVSERVLEQDSSNDRNDPSYELVYALREGYIAARVWPEARYCSFDIHFWSSFEKHEPTKQALLEALGANPATATSFRIVAGGMFGADTWKEDAIRNGPQVEKYCANLEEAQKPWGKVEKDIFEYAIEGAVRVNQSRKIIAGVLCSDESSCKAADYLKKHRKVSQVKVLASCPDIKGAEDLSIENRKEVLSCERELQGIMEEGPKINLLFVDQDAPVLVAEIVDRISWVARDYIYEPHFVVAATMKTDDDYWQTAFLDSFREGITKIHPVFRAELRVSSKTEELDVGLVSVQDERFLEHLPKALKSIEKESKLSFSAHTIYGGKWRHMFKEIMYDEEADAHFVPSDYDFSEPLEQYMAQRPLGQQTIFQLEGHRFFLGDKVLAMAHDDDPTFYSGTVKRVSDDFLYDIMFDDGDFAEEVELVDIKAQTKTSQSSLSRGMLFSALLYALSSEDTPNAKVEEIKVPGDGALFIAYWTGGTVIGVWDGRDHFDLNILTFFENDDVHNGIYDRMGDKIPFLAVALRDEQPRGYGRVVLFEDDLEEEDGGDEGRNREEPHWAVNSKKKIE